MKFFDISSTALPQVVIVDMREEDAMRKYIMDTKSKSVLIFVDHDDDKGCGCYAQAQ